MWDKSLSFLILLFCFLLTLSSGSVIDLHHDAGHPNRPCMGSLKITHYDRSAQTDYRITKLPKRAYKNLTKRLLRRNREVAFVQATGTCCWHMFSDIHFVGEKQHIASGNQYRPTLNIKSLKAVEVSECR